MVIDGFSGLIDILDKLANNSFSQFIIQAGLVSAALYGLGVGFKTLLGTKAMSGVVLVVGRLIHSLNLLKIGASTLAFEFTALTATMLASPLFWITAGVTTIYAIIKGVDALTTSLKEQKEIIETLSTEISNLQSEYDKLLSNENRTSEEEKYLQLLEQELGDKKKLLEIETQRGIQQEFFSNGNNSGGYTGIGGVNASIYGYGKSGQIKKQIEDLKRFQDELSNATTKGEYDKVNEKILNTRTSLEETYKSIQNYISKVDEVPPELQSLADAIYNVIMATNDQTTSTNDATTATDKEIKSIEELAKAITDSQNKLLDLNNAIKEYNENGEFSSETLNSLIKQYPQLIQYLGNEQRLRQELVNIIESESNVQAQNYVDMLQNSEDFYNRILEGQNLLSDNLNTAYGIDLKNYKTLAEAKFDIEKKLLSGFGDMWRDYYDAQSGQMTANISELSRLAAMNDPQAKALLERIRLASQTTTKLNNFSLGLAKTDLGKINISKDKDKKETNLSDILKKEQEYQNKIIEAENKSNNLLNEEYDARLKNLDLEEKAQKALLDYYESQRSVAKLKGLEDELNEKILGVQGKLADIEKTRKDINNDITESVKKQNEESQKNLEDVQKQITEVIKKRYEIEREEAEKTHKDIIDNLEDELDTFKDNIDEQMDEIDKLYDKQNFEKNQDKSTDKISELTNERNTLSMAAQSGDLTAIARIVEIDKELAEERENLLELQQDREQELRKQNLQDALDSKEKEIKNAKDAEDEKYEAIVANYDKLLEEGNLYAEANKALTTGMVTDINGKLVTVTEAFKTFTDRFGETLETLGSNIQTEFIDKLNQAQMLINTMSGLPAGTGIANTDVSNLSSSALSGNILSGANLSSILSGIGKISLGSIMPSVAMPKISGVGAGNLGNINLGDIILNVSGSIDKSLIPTIVQEVAKAQKRELNLAGIYR
jgi:hypothetical protein